MGQPQQQNMMLRGPAPKNKHLTGSHKPSTKAPTLDPILAQQQPNTHIINNPNQQINNQNYINQTVNPNAHIHQNQKKVEPKMQIPGQEQKLDKANKKPSLMTVNSLAGLPYENYPQVEFSSKPFLRISGYGCNSYNGKVKTYNEDKIKIQYKVSKNFVLNNKQYQALISYFGVFDGHGGDKCSQFLKENLDRILFNQTMFPNNVIESIREAFKSAESKFRSIAVQNNKLIDKSGSCALIALIINDILYAINLGDSRGLYSKDGGKEFYQITRDHKPNDNIEKARIEKHGGKVYYANTVIRNGKKIELKEEKFGKDFKFPYRVSPGGLAVARTIGDFYAKIPELGGVKGLVSSDPCITLFKVDDKSDFILMGCDGIFDRLDNEKIFKKIWEYKKQNKSINDIHTFCGQITDAIIKYSMEKDSVDNVSVVFIAFKNFENKMKDPNFVLAFNNKSKAIQKDKVDFSLNYKNNQTSK
jgi:protein phosphatase 2C family protein 2/3